MVREVPPLQQVLESFAVPRSSFKVCTARNAAERPVQSSKLNRETVHRHNKFLLSSGLTHSARQA